jgi:hypothetical protein
MSLSGRMAQLRAAQPESMRLPEGKTCGDCKHIDRCEAFGFTYSRENTWCDFGPSRFVLAPSPERQKKETGR